MFSLVDLFVVPPFDDLPSLASRGGQALCVRIPQLNGPLLYLASNSPRRRQLLDLAGWSFSIMPAGIDETPLEGEQPGAYVLRLAEEKARTAAACIPQNGIVLAADTAVVDPEPSGNGQSILGKPANAAQAAAILRQLRAKTHQVYTAVAVLRCADGRLWTDLSVSAVPMRNYSDAEIDAYIATGDPLDKAGAYAIQNEAFHPVEHFCGCTASVMGMPLCHAAHLLHQAGAPAGNGWASACLTSPALRCPASDLKW